MKKIIHFLKNVCAISWVTLFFWTMIDYTTTPIPGDYTFHLMYTWLLLAFIEGMLKN